MISLREENMASSLEGLCVACKSKEKIKFSEAMYSNRIYKIGTCNSCNYEHVVFIKSIL